MSGTNKKMKNSSPQILDESPKFKINSERLKGDSPFKGEESTGIPKNPTQQQFVPKSRDSLTGKSQKTRSSIVKKSVKQTKEDKIFGFATQKAAIDLNRNSNTLYTPRKSLQGTITTPLRGTASTMPSSARLTIQTTQKRVKDKKAVPSPTRRQSSPKKTQSPIKKAARSPKKEKDIKTKYRQDDVIAQLGTCNTGYEITQAQQKYDIGGIAQKVAIPQAEEIKQKDNRFNRQINSDLPSKFQQQTPATAPMRQINTDLIPDIKAPQMLINQDLQTPKMNDQYDEEVLDEKVEHYIYYEADRTVRNEISSYRREIMEQLEVFREVQKKQIKTHFKQMELNRGGYGHPAYDHMYYQGNNLQDPMCITNQFMNQEEQYRMNLPPPFKPCSSPRQGYENDPNSPASPQSPRKRSEAQRSHSLKKEQEDQMPMNVVPQTNNHEIIEQANIYRAKTQISDPASAAVKYNQQTSVQRNRQQEVHQRKSSPGNRLGNEKSPSKGKKNFIQNNRSNTKQLETANLRKSNANQIEVKKVQLDIADTQKPKKKQTKQMIKS